MTSCRDLRCRPGRPECWHQPGVTKRIDHGIQPLGEPASSVITDRGFATRGLGADQHGGVLAVSGSGGHGRLPRAGSAACEQMPNILQRTGKLDAQARTVDAVRAALSRVDADRDHLGCRRPGDLCRASIRIAGADYGELIHRLKGQGAETAH